MNDSMDDFFSVSLHRLLIPSTSSTMNFGRLFGKKSKEKSTRNSTSHDKWEESKELLNWDQHIFFPYRFDTDVKTSSHQAHKAPPRESVHSEAILTVRSVDNSTVVSGSQDRVCERDRRQNACQASPHIDISFIWFYQSSDLPSVDWPWTRCSESFVRSCNQFSTERITWSNHSVLEHQLWCTRAKTIGSWVRGHSYRSQSRLVFIIGLIVDQRRDFL